MVMRFLTDTLDQRQAFALVIVLFSLATVSLIAVVAMITGARRQLGNARIQGDLKRQMIDRGMSAEEIAHVLDPKRNRRIVPGSVQLPYASEAVVESDGDWYPALVLGVADRQYLVHYVGQDMDSNEWVPETRIRIPAGSPITEFAAGSGRHAPSRNGASAQKPPMEVEV